MNKIPIAKPAKHAVSIAPVVSEAYSQSTPVTRALAARIMSFYKEEAKPEISETQKKLQACFSGWPADDIANRLAQIVEIWTGFKPVLNNPRANKIGQLFKLDSASEIFVVTGMINGVTYGVNVSATRRATISTPINPNDITKAEAGLFAKDILTLNGVKLLTFIASTTPAVFPSFLADLNPEGL